MLGGGLVGSVSQDTLPEWDESQGYSNRAANNSRSSDNGRPKFANVRRNRNLGRTFCSANFLLQHLTKSFTNII